MAVRFPDDNWYGGPGRPFRFEGSLLELEYDGEIPEVLNGAYYRCGPDKQFPPFVDDVWPAVTGDGVVSMFRFQDGHVDFRIRYVMTDRLKREREARRSLFGAYRNPFTDDPAVAGVDRTVANTSVIWYDRRLLALKEDGLPHELNPHTLETIGKFDFSGQLKSETFTAHPKIDRTTGEMTFYGYEAKGLAAPEMVFGVADAKGSLLREEEFVPPYGSMVHDFAVTENYVLFPILPTIADVDRMRRGGAHWTWEQDQHSYIGVMRRDGSPAEMRYFKGPPRWSFHTMNAYEEGSKIVYDTTIARWNRYFPPAEGPLDDPEGGFFRLTRLTCDLARNDDVFLEEELCDLAGDFFGSDPRYAGRDYRHGYMAGRDPSLSDTPAYNVVVHFDHVTRKATRYFPGHGCAVQEPVFVPKSPDAVEGDGYLLVVINRQAERRTELHILDLLQIESGPVATVRLPVLLPSTVHGTFVPEADLRAARAGA